ncbi:MAG: hypothetical protein DMG16_20980 [Acidobacteria bacterium]|nr:MAG: hypothetical protein DMG16_20980 [Acidobacteriota bacterium]
MLTSALLVIVLLVPYFESYPWSPDARCKLNPSGPEGLHPDAYSALRSLSLAHRITQGINHSPGRGNVHDTDGTVNGDPYSGAVDISVRCLTQTQIRTLLARLAATGFAAWYRKDGQDGWTGPPHIHAIWTGCRLKPVLQQQVEDWLRGGNGLYSNSRYQFWQASAEMREKVDKLYHSFN